MISFFNILNIYGIDSAVVKLLRHSDAEIEILDTFKNDLDRLEAYQSFQKSNKFGKANHIAIFAPSRGTTALFLGLWDVKAHKSNTEFTKKIHDSIDKYSFPSKWHDRASWYKLVRNKAIDDLSERLIIEWGAATVAWVQSRDKVVIEIKGKNSIGEFASFDEVQLTFDDLKKLKKDADSNATWVNALSSVNGVYLIKDKSTGKLYVGSAYGENGIYGRWAVYAQKGHGGNVELKVLDPINFEFSILEIAPGGLSADEVIERENRWKTRLGTREFGLNKN